MPLLGYLYTSIVDCFSWWPLNIFSLPKRKKSVAQVRVGYYLWHFPTLSETFVQRELKALKASGLHIEIIADAAADLALLDGEAQSLLKDTFYLYPVDQDKLSKYRRYFFLRQPLLLCSLFLYTATHRYGVHKSFRQDIGIFSKAVLLAGVLKDKKIDHLHAPWADISAFIVALAATLLRVPYSVEARAHDIHRNSYRYALREKFENAAFVITNSKYNDFHLRSVLRQRYARKITVIYNGLNLPQFIPGPGKGSFPQPLKLLCVARLIEQKGLVYLLKACRILKDQGCAFICDILGGAEEPLYSRYANELKQLHGDLALGDAVFFLGAQSFTSVLEKYKTADAFVLPCVVAEDGSRDITPNALIEAMAMRLPVVSTTATAISEIVDDGISGLLVAPRDERALAAALIRLSKDSLLRQRLGKNARRKVEAQFDITVNIKKFVDLFAQKRE